MTQNNFSEAELQKILEDLKSAFPLFSAEDRNSIDSLIKDTSKSEDNLKRDQASAHDEQDSLNNRLSAIASSIGTESDPKKIKETLEARMQMIKSAILYFNDMQKFADFNYDNPLSEIDLQVKQAGDLYQNYVTVTKQTEQLKTLESIISTSTKELVDTVNPKLKRVQIGLNVIDKILDEDEKNKVLRDFFESNDAQIQDIFKRIHSPRELDKVLFLTEESDSIRIQRTNGKKSSIDEISSGQRSALALSIFLALNKKLKNGPNLLLFDDPVAFVDDLNVLSFLDYLREIVINENRQIFFATANQKLASFFDKKFSFLRPTNEFKSFPLQRQVSQ